MAPTDERYVIIRHPETEHEVAIIPYEFDKVRDRPEGSYQEQGYEIIRWQDGETYDGALKTDITPTRSERRAAELAESPEPDEPDEPRTTGRRGRTVDPNPEGETPEGEGG